MKRLHRYPILAAILLAAACKRVPAVPVASMNNPPVPQLEQPEARKSVVVKIRVQHPGGSGETAAGLFVGKDAKHAYFITARHAVVEDPDNLDSALVHAVELQFQGGSSLPAAVLHGDESMDLALLELPVQQLPAALPKVPRSDASPGAAITVVGHPSAGSWSSWNGSVQNTNWTDNGQCFTTTRDQSLAGGYSGGPVFDGCGNFVGMHRETTTSFGIALKSSAIEQRLRAWGAPASFAPASNAGKTDVATDREAILAVIDQYASAYESRDPEAVWKIWPDPPARTRDNIKRSLAAARSITMRITNSHVEPTGATATATAQYSQEFIPKSGGGQRSSGAITFKLRKSCRNWVIESVS